MSYHITNNNTLAVTMDTQAAAPNSSPDGNAGPAATVSDTTFTALTEYELAQFEGSPTDNTFSESDTIIIQDVSEATIPRTFGHPDDYVEMHIYNNAATLLKSEYNFQDYTIPPDQDCAPLTRHIDIDPQTVLKNRTFLTGKFKLVFNFNRNKVFNTSTLPFQIKQISSDRREIKAICTSATNAILKPAINSLISEIESSVYFKELSLNFGGNRLLSSINIAYNTRPLKHEIVLRTKRAIPVSITEGTKFKIVEPVIDPVTTDVDLGDPIIPDDTVLLRSPNFNIEIKHNLSIPSGFKSYDDLLSYNVTSSYEHLLSKLEDFHSADINISYDYIRPVSASTEDIDKTYHFENFVHFGSALERVKNFKYKLKLIELYEGNIVTLNAVTSPSAEVTRDIKSNQYKKQKLIKGFDGYEQFLFFNSGSAYDYPKQNDTKPYVLYSITSSEAKTWLGDERSAFPNYGGQLLSASLFDKQNEHNLNKLIPLHIADDKNNSLYINFVDMIGQHFDNIWTYIKAMEEIHNSDNSRGISKDLVYYQLKSLGIDTFDQFENASLIEYMLGIGSGSNTYDVGFKYGEGHYESANLASETLITASNNSIPKQDISKEIWKRLYHNATYILKTKGTERGLKALMSCYGIPSTILNIKEYGGSTHTAAGPLRNINTADNYKTFTYPKTSYALKGNSGTNGTFIQTAYSGNFYTDFTTNENYRKSIEFRIKPSRQEDKQHLFSISGSTLANGNHQPALDNHLLLDPYTGNDLYESGDYVKFGRLQYYIGTELRQSTDYLPIFNGDFWNINLGVHSGDANDQVTASFGAYQANFLKNILNYTASIETDVKFSTAWNLGGMAGAKYLFFGGVPDNEQSSYNSYDSLIYSGSMQEIRLRVGENLIHSTLKKHALEPFMYAGNTVSSSYNQVVLRLPLGSNLHKNSSSYHPKEEKIRLGGGTSSMSTQEWEEINEYHYLPTPDTVGASMTSDKVRLDDGTVDEDILSVRKKRETSTLDRQPLEYEDLGIFLSPTNELNEDIIYTLGSFKLDDYIGSPLPSVQTASKYEDLRTIRDIYFKKVKRRYSYWDYIKQIQHIDHTLFKVMENFVPFKANTKTGLLIEPHWLERNKIQRHLPVRTDGQTMITGSHQTFEIQISSEYGKAGENKLYEVQTGSEAFGFNKVNNEGYGRDGLTQQWEPGTYVTYHGMPSYETGSRPARRMDVGTNQTIYVYDDYLDPSNRDKNIENAQACQAPVKPIPTSDPSASRGTWKDLTQHPKYKAHDSSVLMGNMMKGKKSTKYYQYTRYHFQSSSLYGGLS